MFAGIACSGAEPQIASARVIGTTLARKYKLVRLLGQGGMGAVYEAHHTGTRRRVAVKVMSSRLLTPGSARRFRREARATSVTDSEHIVPILDSGEDEPTGLLYLVMEHLKGEDLQQLVDRCGPLVPDAALRIAAHALTGLQSAHEAHIVHRDIKPANLFLARRGNGDITVKLLDFGIAKLHADPDLPQTLGLTNTGGLLGSPLYMSPEQVESSRDVDHRTDLWSLGSALYCALAGGAPHRSAPSVSRLLMAICAAPPPPLSEVAPWVSPEIAKVVHGALELRPEARYPSAAAMLEAMRPLLPDGFALREDMLVPVHSERRAAGKAPRLTEAARTAEVSEREPALEGESTADLVTGLNVPLLARIQDRSGSESTADLDAPASAPEAATTGAGAALRPALKSASQVARPRARRWALSVALLLAVACIAVYNLRSLPPGAGAGCGAGCGAGLGAGFFDEPDPDPEDSAEVVASAAQAEPRIVGVFLDVAPSDASVEVDGELVEVRRGIVGITGELGSVHRVRVSDGTSDIVRDVMVTEDGAVPPAVELAAAEPTIAR